MGHGETTKRILDAAGNRVQTVQLQGSTGALIGESAVLNPLYVDSLDMHELLVRVAEATEATNRYLAEIVGDDL